EFSSSYFVVHEILVDRFNKSNIPLHCLAHSLNPRYYSLSWLNEDSNRQPPHQDNEISKEKKNCLKRIFPNNEEFTAVQVEYAKFSGCLESFSDSDSMSDRGKIDPKHWWLLYGSSTLLQKLALKLLGQPSFSSCVESNQSTYSFVHSIKRNKMTPQSAEDLVFVHTNLRLLSRRSPTYKEWGSKMWDVGGDHHDFEDVGVLEVANLSLDEPDMEAVIFTDE
ncbi:LOW QUALITY PROTEIN: Dimer_Tnp_hAT domain-containing protein, partial [Cephalotus follicularis]